jgi:hypothetical protein
VPQLLEGCSSNTVRVATRSATRMKSALIYATVPTTRLCLGAIRSKVNDGPVTTYKTRRELFRTARRTPRQRRQCQRTKPAKVLAVFVVNTSETELTIPFGN